MKTRYTLIALVLLMALAVSATSVRPPEDSIGVGSSDIAELKISLDLDSTTLEIGKEKEIKLALTILAETDSKVWEGECPSSLIYDYSIVRSESDKEIWRWSRDAGKMFATVVTPIVIEGSAKYSEVLLIPAKIFETDGKYSITATFVASGQTATETFVVEFVK